MNLCDAHSAVLEGRVDLSALKPIPDGHPVDVFRKENQEIRNVVNAISTLIGNMVEQTDSVLTENIIKLRGLFNNLYDVDKHYQRKEYLLFPYLEKLEITGPPKVMWGKQDEIREQIKGSIDVLQVETMTPEEFKAAAEMVLKLCAIVTGKQIGRAHV